MKEAYKQKQVIIDEIKDKFERAASVVVIDYIGITVAEADEMRKKLREADVDYTVYKNTLVNKAIEGTEYEAIKDILAGPSGFAFSYDDATAPARVLNGAIREYNKMEFKGGIVEGEYYDKEGLQKLASIPSRDTLISKFMGSIQSPVAQLRESCGTDRGAEGSVKHRGVCPANGWTGKLFKICVKEKKDEQGSNYRSYKRDVRFRAERAG